MFIKSPFCIENRGAFPIHFTVNMGPQFPRWTNIPSSQVTHTQRYRDTAILHYITYITLHYITLYSNVTGFSMIFYDLSWFPLDFPMYFFFQTHPPDLRRIGVAAPGGAVAAPGSQQGSCWLLNGCWCLMVEWLDTGKYSTYIYTHTCLFWMMLEWCWTLYLFSSTLHFLNGCWTLQ